MKRWIWVPAILVVLVVIWLLLNPPRFWANWTKRVQPSPEVGAQLVEKYACRDCHRIAGQGALKAPNLAGVTRREGDPDLERLRSWLRDPSAVRPNTAMPNFRLSDTEIEAIVQYLQALDQQAAGD